MARFNAVRECHRIAPRCDAGQPLLDLRKRASQQRFQVGHDQERRCGLASVLHGLQLTGKNKGSRASHNGDQSCQKTRFPTASQAV